MHEFFINVIDEAGGRVRTRWNKHRNGAIVMPVGDKSGHLGVVFVELHQRHGSKGRFLITDKMIDRFLHDLIAGRFAQYAVFQARVNPLAQTGTHKQAEKKAAQNNDADDQGRGDGFIIAIREINVINHQIR